MTVRSRFFLTATAGCVAALLLAGASTVSAQIGGGWGGGDEWRSLDQATGGQDMTYGPAPLQKLRFWRATDPNAPLVIFVHGGGWKHGDLANATGSAKVQNMRSQGYAFASIDYRLVPDATVDQEARDVAAAAAYLIAHASELGVDPTRVVLMGHSAGAHLVALVGTDPFYLQQQGLSLSAIRGIVPIDGAAYDVARQIDQAGRFIRRLYTSAFGTDRDTQRKLSPTLQAAAPNVASFLILHVQRPDGVEQSQALARALTQAGVSVQIQGFEGQGLSGHVQINQKLGDPSYPATAVLDAWLQRVFAKR